MSKAKRNAEIGAAIARLADLFPKAFAVNAILRKPLKVGIANDLTSKVDGMITPLDVHRALAAYCGSVGYLRHMKAGAARLDLDGNAAGTVTAEEAEQARKRLVATLTKRAAAAEATKLSQPKPAAAPSKRDGLSDQRTAARQRKTQRA
jgi:ProP effector